MLRKRSLTKVSYFTGPYTDLHVWSSRSNLLRLFGLWISAHHLRHERWRQNFGTPVVSLMDCVIPQFVTTTLSTCISCIWNLQLGNAETSGETVNIVAVITWYGIYQSIPWIITLNFFSILSVWTDPCFGRVSCGNWVASVVCWWQYSRIVDSVISFC